RLDDGVDRDASRSDLSVGADGLHRRVFDRVVVPVLTDAAVSLQRRGEHTFEHVPRFSALSEYPYAWRIERHVAADFQGRTDTRRLTHQREDRVAVGRQNLQLLAGELCA